MIVLANHIPDKVKPILDLCSRKGFGIYIHNDKTFSLVFRSGRLSGRYSDIINAMRYLERQPDI